MAGTVAVTCHHGYRVGGGSPDEAGMRGRVPVRNSVVARWRPIRAGRVVIAGRDVSCSRNGDLPGRRGVNRTVLGMGGWRGRAEEILR